MCRAFFRTLDLHAYDPEMIDGMKLDLYLSMGYFRMQQTLFTCRYVHFDNVFSAVHWLRIDLKRAILGRKQRDLLKVRNKFTTDVKPFILTNEMEDLYGRYRNSINFDAPHSVESCLFDGFTMDAFDTYAVEIRDAGKLIAVGVFDNGCHTIAGIMNFYDPEYRKYSLGKTLMLLKMEAARHSQKAYYYPGYIASSYPKLDYKLFPCEAATEVYDDYADSWLPFSWATINLLMEGDVNRP